MLERIELVDSHHQGGQLLEDGPDASPLFSFSLVLEEIKHQRHVK